MSADRPVMGIGLMLGFCVLASLGDAVAKLLGESVSLGQILYIRFAVQALLLAPLVWLMGGSLRLSPRVLRLTWLRTVLHIAGVGAMFTSLRFLPLADAVAIAFVMPYTVFAGREYSIVLYQQGNSGSDNCSHRWYEDPTGSYSNGMVWQSSDGGANWTKGAGGTHDFYFATYVNGHCLLGTLESSSYDCGIGVEFGTISWDSQVPGVTELKFQIATNNDSLTWSFIGPDGTPATYYETNGADIWSGHDGKRYIRYKAYLRTTDYSRTPEFEEVRITYR